MPEERIEDDYEETELNSNLKSLIQKRKQKLDSNLVIKSYEYSKEK